MVTKRKVFFSFHFQRDIWRVSQVRNCNVVTTGYTKNDFLDAASWEAVRRQGDEAVKRWINNQLNGTSVTIILIGAETSTRKYVGYEIEQSYKRGNGLLGIRIHGLMNQDRQIDYQGANPFDNFYLNGNELDKLSKYVPVYDWITHDGRNNIGKWIESVAPKNK